MPFRRARWEFGLYPIAESPTSIRRAPLSPGNIACFLEWRLLSQADYYCKSLSDALNL
jgi:hypothetical protein